MKMLPRNGRGIGAAALALTALVAGAASAQSDCTPDHKFPTIKPGVLTIAEPDFPPIFTYKNGVMGGLDGLFFEKFAKANCLKVEVMILPIGGIVESVRNGLADVGGPGFTGTPERGKVVGLTNKMYYNRAVFVGKDPSANLDDYGGKVLGTVTGFVWNSDVQAWGKANLRLYDSADIAFADLQTGRLPVSLFGEINAQYRISLAPGRGLKVVVPGPHEGIAAFNTPNHTQIIHTKANNALTEALDADIENWRADGTLLSFLQKVNLPADLLIPSKDASKVKAE
ncbi:substrate-binding periplasmic protein [Bradyrhizobium manausense]